MASDKNDIDNKNGGSQDHDDVHARIEKLKAKAFALSNGQMRSYVAPNLPPKVAEEFWKRVVAAEEEDKKE